MQNYSAGYTNTTNHFVIQNLPFFSQKVVEEEKTKFAFLLRFLQRSLVMPLPMELAERFNTQDNQTENYIPLLPLQISEKHKYTPKWKFEQQSKQNSSEKAMRLFLRERLQSYLPEWGFLEFLFWANAPLSEVLQQEIAQDDIYTELKNTVVNFYLPIAELAVLIVTGSEEREKLQKIEQKLRSKGIYVVSFTAEEIVEETDLIREKMEWIRHQVEKPIFSNKLREWSRTTTNQPRETIIQQIWWKAALIRVQILTTEMLFRGIWKLDDKAWNTIFLMREREQIPKEIIELAIESVQKLALQLFPELTFNLPQLSITTTFSDTELDKIQDKNTLKIDFSILHRWTDSDTNKDWIKIRNDYAENYRFSFHSDEGKPLSRQLFVFSHSFFKAKTNFQKWNFENHDDIKRSQFLLDSFSNQNLRENTNKNQSSFLQILLAKALNGQSVLANLPLQTDSVLLFGWLSVLQSLPSLLICASTDVALDKMEELSKNGIDKVTVWHSEMSSQEIKQAQDLIKENKVFLLILTADLLNTKAFINFISNADDKNDKINWAYFLVDEIHRFSEWSPQHKKEYIALERIYHTYFYNDSHKTPFVFLSHFLDKSVSKTIQNTFKIDSANFYGAVSSTEFLENKISNFEFIETENTYSSLVALLKKIQNLKNDTENKAENNKESKSSGIIFTSSVNGSTGSYLLSERLEFDLKRQVYPYSIEIPNNSHDDKETHFIKRNYLRNALKTNQDVLVASTAALNSGINLENLDFIIQYGLPKSLTELLDISNRTKKQTAKTYIIFQKEKDEKTLHSLFESSTKLSDIRNMHREVSWLGGDMYRHLLEWAARVEPVQEEVDFMKQFYDKYCLVDINEAKNTESKIIKISDVEISDLDFRVFSQKVDRKLTVERTIIRFYQMGILSNWEYSTHISNTKFKIWVQAHDQTSVRNHIFTIINTHESNFEIHKDDKYAAIFSMKNYSILEKYSFLFLQWIHENSIYHFKNNLKEVYRYAKNQVEQNEPTPSIFSEPFLHHSSINRLLYFIEKEEKKKEEIEIESFSNQELDWIFEELEKITSETTNELNLDFIEKWRKIIPQNTILDFYKAISELYLQKFDTENAPTTLFNSLNKIIKKTIKNNNFDFFVKKYVSFGTNLSEEAKSYLSESILINEFEEELENNSKNSLKNKHKRATQIYSSLNDIYSLTILLQLEIEKIKMVQLEVQGT